MRTLTALSNFGFPTSSNSFRKRFSVSFRQDDADRASVAEPPPELRNRARYMKNNQVRMPNRGNKIPTDHSM